MLQAMKRSVTVGGVLPALLSGLLLILAFPKFDLHFIAWIALVPLLLTLKNKSLKAAFVLSCFTGFVFLKGFFYWLTSTHGLELSDYFLLGVYLLPYFGLFGLALNFVSQKTKFPPIFAVPLIWISLEYLRANAGFLAHPWGLLGHTQYLNIPLIQISSITGVYGVSFLIVTVNAVISESILLWLSRRKEASIMQNRPSYLIPTLTATTLLGICLAYGFNAISREPESDKIRVTVIQGNISPELLERAEYNKLRVDQHVRLTKEAVNGGLTSLVVWPETSVPGSLHKNFPLRNTLTTLAMESQAHLLVGSSQRPKFGSSEFRKQNWFNSAVLISHQRRIVKQYNKIRLVPFGEYLPYKDLLPWPSRFASRASNFIPGKEYTIFIVDGAKFGVTICWENIFPDHFRQFVKRGANFMLNITNLAWFGETANPYQLEAMGVFRAVENRISVAHAANTGISGFIDPYGRVLGKVEKDNKDIFVEGYLTMDVPLSQRRTFYTLYGDVFAYINLILTALIIVVPLFKNSLRAKLPSIP